MAQYIVPIIGPGNSGSGTITVNASDATSAAINAQQGGNTVTGNPVPVGGAAPVTSGTPTATSPTGTGTGTTGTSGQLAQGVQGVLGAASSGNAAALGETIREFDKTFGLSTEKAAEDTRQFNANLGVQQAGLTGTYNGQPTQAAQLQSANIANQVSGQTGYYVAPGTGGGAAGTGTPFTQDQYVAARTTQLVGMGWTPAAATQTAVSEWGQGMAQAGTVAGGMPAGLPAAAGAGAAAGTPYTGVGYDPSLGTPTMALQAQNATLYGVNGAPAPGATTLAAQNQTYNQGMGVINAASQLQANPFRQAQVIGQAGRLLNGQSVAGFSAPNTVAGVGTAGGNTQGGLGYLSQLIDDIKDPTSNQTTVDSWLAATPTPNKLDSVSFMKSSPTTQSLVLQGIQEKYGLDPTDSLAQIKNTLPQFSAPNTLSGTVRRG